MNRKSQDIDPLFDFEFKKTKKLFHLKSTIIYIYIYKIL